MARSLNEIIASLNPAYDPETAALTQAQAALPGQQSAELAGLDTAKNNAFGEITTAANRRGMLYSGAPVDEQMRYVGERYLPARAQVANTFAGRQSDLQLKLANVAQRKMNQAQGILEGEQKQDLAKAEAERQYQLEVQKMRQTASRATSSRAAVDPAKGYVKGTDNVGGLSYRDARGNPITSAQYYEAKGATGIGAIIADLKSSKNPNDIKIAREAESGKYTYDQLAQKFPYVFGGV